MKPPVKHEPQTWVCPWCGLKVPEPKGLLKGYVACGHRCPKTLKWSDFEVKR